MPETAHKNFFLTRKVLALLPLLLLGAGAWYFIQVRAPAVEEPAAPDLAGKVFGAKSDPAAAPVDSAAGVAAARLPDAYDPRAGIEMQGSDKFKSQVTSALKLIWTADRDSFLFIKRNLYVIRNETQTGFYMENGRPVAALSNDHAFRSVTWCAGILAHQAWHAAYTLGKKRKKVTAAPPPPGETRELEVEANPMKLDYKGLDAIFYIEDRAFTFQLQVLRKVGAPVRETGPVFRRAPRDFKLAHDGNYTIKP